MKRKILIALGGAVLLACAMPGAASCRRQSAQSGGGAGASASAGREKAEISPVSLRFAVDERGNVSLEKPDAASRESGTSPPVSLGPREVAEALGKACAGAGTMPWPPRDEDAAEVSSRKEGRFPLRLNLRWSQSRRTCTVAVGSEKVGTDEEGLAKAEDAMAPILAEETNAVEINVTREIPCRWVLRALDLATRLRPGRIFLLPVTEKGTYPAIDAVLEPVEGGKRFGATLPAVEVLVRVSPEAPWSSAGQILEACLEARIYRVFLQDATQGMKWKAFLPVFEDTSALPSGGK